MKMKKTPWHKRIYALYKGENLIADGTIGEIHRKSGKTVEYLRWMTYPTYEKRCRGSEKRLQMVLLDED
jgi:hypothetical protein